MGMIPRNPFCIIPVTSWGHCGSSRPMFGAWKCPWEIDRKNDMLTLGKWFFLADGMGWPIFRQKKPWNCLNRSGNNKNQGSSEFCMTVKSCNVALFLPRGFESHRCRLVRSGEGWCQTSGNWVPGGMTSSAHAASCLARKVCPRVMCCLVQYCADLEASSPKNCCICSCIWRWSWWSWRPNCSSWRWNCCSNIVVVVGVWEVVGDAPNFQRHSCAFVEISLWFPWSLVDGYQVTTFLDQLGYQ